MGKGGGLFPHSDARGEGKERGPMPFLSIFFPLSGRGRGGGRERISFCLSGRRRERSQQHLNSYSNEMQRRSRERGKKPYSSYLKGDKRTIQYYFPVRKWEGKRKGC